MKKIERAKASQGKPKKLLFCYVGPLRRYVSFFEKKQLWYLLNLLDGKSWHFCDRNAAIFNLYGIDITLSVYIGL
jgi:hypothetical protein